MSHRSCFKQPQSHGPPPDWRSVIPTSGTVSLDYVSTQPPGAMAQTLIWGAPSTPTVVSSNKVTAAANANTRSSLAAGGGRGPSAESARQSTASAGSAGAGAVGGSVTGGEGELCAATEQQLTSLMRSQVCDEIRNCNARHCMAMLLTLMICFLRRPARQLATVVTCVYFADGNLVGPWGVYCCSSCSSCTV